MKCPSCKKRYFLITRSEFECEKCGIGLRSPLVAAYVSMLVASTLLSYLVAATDLGLWTKVLVALMASAVAFALILWVLPLRKHELK